VLVAVTVAALVAACTAAPQLPSAAPSASPSPAASSTSAPSAPASSDPTDPAGSPSPTDTPPASESASPTPAATGIEGELAAPGVLSACVSVVGAPAAGLTEEGQLDGYNVAFAAELASRLGLEVEIQQPLFEELIEQVSSHACDISVSSQNITSSRSAEVSFVPYTRSNQPVVVEIGNPESIYTLEDLCGLPVSATAGTTHIDLVEGTGDYVGQGINDQCAAGGGEPIDLQAFQTELEAVTALLDGDVMAYLGNPSFVFDFPDRIVYSEADIPAARQGIAVALDHPSLLAAIESALAAMIADGVYRGILVEHLPNDASVDAVSIEEAPG